MNAELVSDKRDGDYDENHDENNALFVPGELENPEQAPHFLA